MGKGWKSSEVNARKILECHKEIFPDISGERALKDIED
jgi:hypothetical protein